MTYVISYKGINLFQTRQSLALLFALLFHVVSEEAVDVI